ncbi:hypothetical protein GAU_3362 [Gemmatimonas aurantiaca T-27]|uniref:TonB C-terminal domain-containing protein n=2 Tax=Gemmatimonas aurantiaca TaxID=173480 RepID=C1AD27_GEMAT|nr:hypothetical protein [Gemmatimonas aurantiaca]BAH40404.1 hypothetical protein GAU_3362 [Gemmatimonas aurantiaca T-27]
MLSRSRAQWRVPSGVPRSGMVMDLRIEVLVGPDGKPDIETLRVTGLGAAENRDVVVGWLQESRFQPAQKDGQPVSGTFKTRVQLRGEVRRIGG